jgi:hypothetical protein
VKSTQDDDAFTKAEAWWHSVQVKDEPRSASFGDWFLCLCILGAFVFLLIR